MISNLQLRGPIFRILPFFLLAYSISWTAWIILFVRHLSPFAGLGFWLYVVAVVAPHASAMLCTAAETGGTGLRAFYRLVFRGPSFAWGLMAISVPPLVNLARDALAVSLHLPHGQFVHQPPRTLALLILGQLVVVLGEEPGWRGFALPRLMDRLGPIVGTLTLGAAWGLWHLPLFAVRGTAQYGTSFLPFVITLIAWSMVITLVVLESRGGVIGAMLFHASANVSEFTMWEPTGSPFSLGPWLVVAVAAGWWMRSQNQAPTQTEAEGRR